MSIIERMRFFLTTLRQGAEASTESKRLLDRLIQLQLKEGLFESARFREPERLLASAYKVYSQGYEDGMIEEVFSRIGTASKRFIEFGIENGLECNSTYLLLKGWRGAWIESSSENVNSARETFRTYPVEIVNSLVTAENAAGLIAELARGEELDLLCIDIDFNDYWVWKSIDSVMPRLVVIEYNATLPPHLSKVVAYDADRSWDGTNYCGASLAALTKLGRAKGYSLVGCSPSGVNAFFVRDDLVGDKFCPPYTAENHYEPPRYGLWEQAGHRPGFGPWEDV